MCTTHGPDAPVLTYRDGYVTDTVCGRCWFDAIREQQIGAETLLNP